MGQGADDRSGGDANGPDGVETSGETELAAAVKDTQRAQDASQAQGATWSLWPAGYARSSSQLMQEAETARSLPHVT